MAGAEIYEWALALILLLAGAGMLLTDKPVYASFYFLLTLLAVAAFYFQLATPLIATLQILIYAGAILVIFIFVIVLFQDAHSQILHHKANSIKGLLICAGLGFAAAFFFFAWQLTGMPLASPPQSTTYGTAQSLGRNLMVAYFVPFEVLLLPLLVAAVGALYIGKREK